MEERVKDALRFSLQISAGLLGSTNIPAKVDGCCTTSEGLDLHPSTSPRDAYDNELWRQVTAKETKEEGDHLASRCTTPE
jgi:hypothetical protein